MYSAFYDPFHVSDSGLKGRLKREGITDVFVVGLAADYCVRATAEHAVDEGFRTFVVEEGTRPVMVDQWKGVRREIEEHGVMFVKRDGEEVKRVQALKE